MPRQNLTDILGKTGDFQFSFGVQDLITPAVESIDSAAQSLSDFFDKQSKKVARTMTRGQKFLKNLFGREVKKAQSATERLFDTVKDGATSAQKGLEDIHEQLTSFQENIQATSLKGALGDLETGKLTDAAQGFVETMGDVANTLGKNRKEMGSLTEEVIRGVEKQSWFAASAGDAMASVKGLTEAGVRSTKMLQDMAPRVAIAANAVQGDVGDIAGIFYEMEDRVGLTGSQIEDVLANWKKTSEATAISFKDVQDTFTNPEFYADFRRLTANMSEDTRVQMLSTLGHVRGAFADEWADSSDFINKIMGAMTDPRLAHEMQRMTGMTAEQVKSMLQTTEGSAQFFTQFMDHVDKTAQSGTGSIKLWEETLGFASGSLLELQKESESIRGTFTSLQQGTVAVGEGAALLTKRATENMTATTMWGKALSHLAAKDLPIIGRSLLDRAAILAEIPWTQVFAFGSVLGALASVQIPATIAGFLGLEVAAGTAGVAVSAALVPLLVFAAKAALVVAAIYAIGKAAAWLYNNFDRVKEMAFKVYDFFLGTGELEKGWVGTLQGLLRITFLPLRALIGMMGALSDAAVTAVNAFLEWGPVKKVVGEISDFFGRMWENLKQIIEAIPKLANLLKNALVGKINQGLIDPINAKLDVSVFGKTLGERMGIQKIPRLGDGGVTTDPILAVVGDRDEAIVPLDQYDRLLTAAAMSNAAAQAPVTPRSPDVIVSQDRVVDALVRLERTLTELLRRSDLPTRGSGFAGSPAASPRGF